MKIWLMNQPWNGLDHEITGREVEWNMWQSRLKPFTQIQPGDILFVSYRDSDGTCHVTSETRITSVLRASYESFLDAAELLNDYFGTIVDDPQSFDQWPYCIGKPSSGWLLGVEFNETRRISPPVPRSGVPELKVNVNGWRDLSELDDKDLRRLRLIGQGKPPPPKREQGQGRSTDAELRRKIEMHAMATARRFLEKELGFEAYEIIDTSTTKPYDLECQRNGEAILRVEVKGTVEAGTSVLVTPNEVLSARKGKVPTALFVQSRIELVPDKNDELRAKGGESTWENPWRATESSLEVETYRYRVEKI